MSIITFLGISVLTLGGFAAWFLKRCFQEGKLGRTWRFAEAAVLIVGVGLGIAAVAHSRYPTADTRLLGFPFLAAVFERSPSGGWADFFGLVTFPATIGNFLVGLLLPHLPFALVAWLCIRKPSAA